MPNWMSELEDLVKGMGGKDRDYDEDDDKEYEGDEDEEGEDEMPAPKPRAKKSVTDPKPNAETTEDTPDSPEVFNPRSLDRRTGGGPISAGGKGGGTMRKGIEDVVSDDTADAMEVSEVLGDLAKGINSLAGQNDSRITRLEKGLARLEKGLGVIGSAIAKSISLQNETAKDLETIGQKPQTRKAITKSVERKFADDDNSAPSVPTAQEVMTKSMQALRDGRISTQDAARLENARNKGKWNEVADLWNRTKG